MSPELQFPIINFQKELDLMKKRLWNGLKNAEKGGVPAIIYF